MAKARVTIVMEIEYDELQYEQDGFIGPTNVKEAFEDEFNPNQSELISGFDFCYRIDKLDIKVEA